MPTLEISGSTMRTVPEVGQNMHIIENSALEWLLFDRSLVGLEFTRLCEAASCCFLRHYEAELKNQGEALAELMILSKGQYYWFHNAFEKTHNENLQTNFIATNRVQVAGDNVQILVSYRNYDAPADQLLIGDTVASGGTICNALDDYLKKRSIDKLYLFSIAGTRIGAIRIAKFCKERGIELQCAFGLALFGLGENGFDLSFLHPDTLTSPKYINLANKIYEGKQISVAGWDFGSQSQSPQKYRNLSWMEAKKWRMEGSDLFKLAEMPESLQLIEKERDAFRFLPLPDKNKV